MKNKKNTEREPKIRQRRNPFTLIELSVAMAVFAIMMLVMMQFFSTAQQAWSAASAKSEVYSNARTALDIMTRDLQCAYYAADKNCDPYFLPTSNTLSFLTVTNLADTINNDSSVFEVKYHLDSEGYLVRDITGDSDTANYDWGDPNNTPATVFGSTTSPSDPEDTRVIPCVTSLNFTTYPSSNPFPQLVLIKISMLDKKSWKKWKALTGTPADNVKKARERTFTKYVFLGDREQ